MKRVGLVPGPLVSGYWAGFREPVRGRGAFRSGVHVWREASGVALCGYRGSVLGSFQFVSSGVYSGGLVCARCVVAARSLS